MDWYTQIKFGMVKHFSYFTPIQIQLTWTPNYLDFKISTSGFRLENVSYLSNSYVQVVKSQLYLDFILRALTPK